jgi:hypothetical protein
MMGRGQNQNRRADDRTGEPNTMADSIRQFLAS